MGQNPAWDPAQGQWPLCTLSHSRVLTPPSTGLPWGPKSPPVLPLLESSGAGVGAKPPGTQHNVARGDPAQSAGWVMLITAAWPSLCQACTQPCEGDCPPQVPP